MNKTLTILVCIMVAGVVVGASLPIFDSLTASSESVHNEGAGWVRFALDRNAGTTYSLSFTDDDDGFYIDNGTDRQTYDDSTTSDFETILYADSNLSVWHDGTVHILGTNEGNPVYLEGSGPLTIVRDADGVTVTPNGLDPITFGVPTWSYIPVSTGNYGFFLAADLDSELGNGVKNYPSDMPLAVVGGGFAGVYAYNDIYRYNGLGLNMHPVYDDDGLFYGAYWDKTAPVEPESLTPDVFDPSVIDFDPSIIDLDPIVLDPGASIMSVPTPTYTDGDWGYDLTTVDGVTKAIIVSYSGAGGGIITVPATVGGYDVYQVGKGGSNETVIATSTSGTDLVISEGIEVIGKYAFSQCTLLTGTLTLPSTLKIIDHYAFYKDNLKGTLTLPDGLTSIGVQSFGSCKKFTGDLVIPDSVTSLGLSSFSSATGMTGTLTLPKYITTIPNSCFSATKFTGNLIIPNGVTVIDSSAFSSCNKFTGDLILPSSVTTINHSAFYDCKGLTGTLLIPSSVTTFDGGPFVGEVFTNVIIVSDATPTVNLFQYGVSAELLDLSDAIDYSSNQYGMDASVVVSDSIGDCFGFVSVVDVSGNGGSPTQTLIAMLPLVMVLGLVLVAVGMFLWNRM